MFNLYDEFIERELKWARDNRSRLLESIDLLKSGLMHSASATSGEPADDTSAGMVKLYQSQLSEVDSLIQRLESDKPQFAN